MFLGYVTNLINYQKVQAHVKYYICHNLESFLLKECNILPSDFDTNIHLKMYCPAYFVYYCNTIIFKD